MGQRALALGMCLCLGSCYHASTGDDVATNFGEGEGEGEGQGEGEGEGEGQGEGEGEGELPRLKGLDLLVVVDNSGSMTEEQQILATSFFTLLNALVHPMTSQGMGESVNDVRVAVVTSDLGLQYGGMEGPPGVVTGCDAKGDDGAFQVYSGEPTVAIQDNQIACEANGHQCPNDQWACEGGKCQAPNADGEASCPPLADNYAETSAVGPNDNLAFQVACLTQTGTYGCGLEQQLEAAAVALESHPQFVRDDYLLAVLVVTDEEDCSIKDKGLFETKQFMDKVKGLNTACNYPQSNEQLYLFDPSRYRDLYVKLKGNANHVVFAAIAGVPMDSASDCQGRGNEIGDACLVSEPMQLKTQEFTDPAPPNTKYWHFAPACTRDDDPRDDKVETEARPGRRYVKVAQSFGSAGYVYSICNKDWSPAMEDIAGLLSERLDPAR